MGEMFPKLIAEMLELRQIYWSVFLLFIWINFTMVLDFVFFKLKMSFVTMDWCPAFPTRYRVMIGYLPVLVFPYYRNQSTDLHFKSVGFYLYDGSIVLKLQGVFWKLEKFEIFLFLYFREYFVNSWFWMTW